MRIRPVLILPLVALVSAVSMPTTVAQADGPPTSGTAAVAAAAVRTAPAKAVRTAVLPTGERVRLVGAAGHQRVSVSRQAASGPGRTMITRRLGKQTYVFPAVAEPYLGRFLDPELFDASRLATLQAGRRLPVKISYRGSAPAVPGVKITAAAGGAARGYLTPHSSKSFGSALTKQWLADSGSHFAHRSTLFPGITAIRLDAASLGGVEPAFVQYTLIIKMVGSDGKPQPQGLLTVLNLDSGRKYSGFASAEDGEARISVPAGRYSVIGDEFLYDEAAGHGTLHITAVDEYAVTGAGQTLTVDQRKATARPRVSTPRPAGLTEYVLELDRTDAKENVGVGTGYLADDLDVFLAPLAKPARGTFTLTQSWVLDSAGGVSPAYHYDLASTADAIAADLHETYPAAELATVNASYYGDGSTSPAGFSRTALFENGGLGVYDRVVRGTARTEYAGAHGGDVLWADSALVNDDSDDDPGFFDGDIRELPPASIVTVDWFRGPLAAAIPTQSGPGFCFACRTNKHLALGVVPVTDTDPTHLGYLLGAGDGLPVARFRLYRDKKLVRDADDSLGDDVVVTSKRARYQAVIDVNRRLVEPVQSTQSHTEFGFTSKKGTGKKLSKRWFCGYSRCRVLPLVQAKVALPTTLNGRLAAGKVPVTVSVARIQGATPSAAKSAHLDIRPAGYGWTSVDLTANGDGTFSGVIDNTDLENSLVDVRVRGTDKAGSTYDQTVLRAYTVANA